MSMSEPSKTELLDALGETRIRTLELVADLNEEQLLGPRLAIVNPLRWEIAHVAWFQEFWVLRHFGRRSPLLEHGDSLYDSARVAHDTRWDLPLLSRPDTLRYMQQVLEEVIKQTVKRDGRPATLQDDEGYNESYFLQLALLHEQMHDEAIAYTRQTHGYPPPKFSARNSDAELLDEAPNSTSTQTCDLTEDAEIPGGTFMLGTLSEGFSFDNEHRAHEVTVKPFAISKTAVTNAAYRTFVEHRGYNRREFWSEEGWQWKASVDAQHPVYWRCEQSGNWLRRNFDAWVPLEEYQPVIHVNWFEANAFCRWAGRRLPTEAEWEFAASVELEANGRATHTSKRAFPWGNDSPTSERANLDWRTGGCVAVDSAPAGDSAFGCRQMIGNVWEWTATAFGPYPGFTPGPYKEYSEPWFGDHKVLRGGCWATRSRLIHNSYRNFYTPDRRDVWAGFRTCAL